MNSFLEVCTKFKLGSVIAIFISFLLGFGIAFFDGKTKEIDLIKINTELQNRIEVNSRNIEVNKSKLDSLKVIGIEQNATVDSLILTKIVHLNERIAFQTVVIQDLLDHLRATK
jgi:hypothetical protein